MLKAIVVECRRIVVSGRVQGVGFRYYILKVAQDLELKGFVRNLPNGKVEIEVEGPLSEVEMLVDYCRVGPARAIVERVTSSTQPLVGYESFVVR